MAVKILGILGSVRAESYNRMLLEAARELVPEGAELEIFDHIGDIPPFTQDNEMNLPASVRELKEKIKNADAILFCSPEYNYSIPGVLKNAIDYASRPYGDNSFAGKPAAIMGASIGTLGTARMQYHLRQTMVFLDMHPLNKPEVMVGPASERFEGGRLTNEKSRELVKNLLEALVVWTLQLQKK